jgi:hypothetical protein
MYALARDERDSPEDQCRELPAPGKISDLMVRSLRENSGADLWAESVTGGGVKIAFTVKAAGRIFRRHDAGEMAAPNLELRVR